MTTSDRRRDPRVNARIPLRFRVLGSSESVEQFAESENISQRGIYFTTTVPLQVGMPLEVSLRMPRELAGKMSNEVKCVARVVRVLPISHSSGKVGIGLHIEQYRVGAAASEQWMS